MKKLPRLILTTILAVHFMHCTSGSTVDAIVAETMTDGARTPWMAKGERMVEMTPDGYKRPLRIAPAYYAPQP